MCDKRACHEYPFAFFSTTDQSETEFLLKFITALMNTVIFQTI